MVCTPGGPTSPARLITACVAREGRVSARRLHALAAAITDWDRVVELAERHRVSGLVSRALAATGVLPPEQARARLQASQRQDLATVLTLDAQLLRLAAAYAAEQIPLLVLKGPALARTIYAARDLRPYTDLDLAVQAPHEQAAVALLQAHGFTELDYAAEQARRAHAGHMHGAAFHRMFTDPKLGTLVELHLDPLQLGLVPVCEAARWQRAVPLPGVPGTLMLSPDDQLVQLAVHAHKHGFERLIWLKDLDCLLERAYGAIDWQRAAATARQEGIAASVWFALTLARGILGTPVEDGHLRALAPSLPLRLLYPLIWQPRRIAALDGAMRRRAVQFHAAESLRGMLPSLVLMGRRGDRARAALDAGLGQGRPARPLTHRR